MALNFEKLNYFVYSPDYKDFIVKGEPDQTDLVLIAGIDKRTFRGHRLVVSAASRVLRSLLTASSYDDDISYVTLAGSDGEALENFLCLCYTGKTLPFETAEDASNFLKALKPLDLQGIELDNADNVDWDEIRKYFDHQPETIQKSMGFFECKMLSHDLSDSSDYLAKEDEFYFYQSDAEDLEVSNAGSTSSSFETNRKTCPYCLKVFRSEEVCTKHIRHCARETPTKLVSGTSSKKRKNETTDDGSNNESDSEMYLSKKQRHDFSNAEIDDQRKFVNTSAYRMSADGRYSCLDPTCKSRGSFASKYGVIEHWQDKHAPDSDRIHPCSYCGLRFALASLRNRHVHNVHEPRFSCQFCNKKFFTKVTLQNHERCHLYDNEDSDNSIHEDSNEMDFIVLDSSSNQGEDEGPQVNVFKKKVFKCRFCLEEFSVRSAYNCHMEEHHDEATNQKKLDEKTICQKLADGRFICLDPSCKSRGSFAYKYGVIEHWQDKHAPDSDRIYHCDYCDLRFALASIRNRHVNNMHELRFACEYCEKKFPTKVIMQNHVKVCPNLPPEAERLVQPPSNQNEAAVKKKKRTLECRFCFERFSVRAAYRRHMDEHREERKAESQVNRNTIFKEDDQGRFLCLHPDCTTRKSFSHRNGAFEHWQDKHAPDSDRIYHCDYCDRKFALGSLRNRHIKYAHELNHCCTFCDKKFPLKLLLEVHERLHTGEKPFVCELCGNSYRSQKSYNEHQITHLTQKISSKFQCDECDKTFDNKKDMIAHKHEFSTLNDESGSGMKFENGRYHCSFPGCNASFQYKHGCREHFMEKHLSESDKKFDCRHCSKKFGTNAMRNKHETLKHELTFECEHCDRKFGRKALLLQHVRWHTGEKPFVCDICGTRFLQKNYLRQHIDSQHAGGEVRKDFNCEVCDKSFRLRGQLNNHMKITHSNTRSFVCEECGKNFKDLWGLKRHQETHVKEGIACATCNVTLSSKLTLARHYKTVHGGVSSADPKSDLGSSKIEVISLSGSE